jgi:hypothetical protein
MFFAKSIYVCINKDLLILKGYSTLTNIIFPTFVIKVVQ